MANTSFNNIDQYQLYSRPRHMRFVFLVAKSFTYSQLSSLIRTNLRYWGGRYNPIIPTEEGTIKKEYVELASQYDPDIVFYSDDVDIQQVKELKIFNPHTYQKLGESHIEGVNAFYLTALSGQQGAVLMPRDLYNLTTPLFEFYQINYGLTSSGVVSDYGITRNLQQVVVGSDNYGSINETIHREKPISGAQMAKVNAFTSILRSQNSAEATASELVIAKDQTCKEDLLYYWNRQLYDCYNVIYVTVEELMELCKDRYFGGILYDLTQQMHIDVVSLSLTDAEVNSIILHHIMPIGFNRLFKYKKIDGFPFPVTDGFGNASQFHENMAVQALYGGAGIVTIPVLSFTSKLEFERQRWAIDVQIRKAGTSNHNWLAFPLTTDSTQILKTEGRVNKYRQLCYYTTNDRGLAPAIDVNIPTFSALLPQLIQRPVVNGEIKPTIYQRVGLHDSSRRLTGFLQTFNYDFDTIDEFFCDKYWVDIFEDLCTSGKAAGDSISFGELSRRCQKVFDDLGIKFGPRDQTRMNFENMEKGLLYHLERLCKLGVFITGYKLKCSECSSIYWYNLDTTRTNILCKGCLQTFGFRPETKFYYKLNDLVRNNIFQSRQQRDGNLAVIRTLVHLALRRGFHSFDFSPQIDLFDNYDARKPINEIDINAIGDGRFIIGESKHNSQEFYANQKRSLNALIEVTREINPDIIILSCYVDAHSKLQKAVEYLKWNLKNENTVPDIIALHLHTPDYSRFKSAEYFYY